MDYNYHTHTFRCAHATGREIEYIRRAIKHGIKYMGFSDHAPFMFPDGHQSYYRVPMELGEEYITTLTKLRERYKDRIDIKIGFEMEYYPLHFKDMFKIAKDLGAEYLILGQHFIYNEYPNGKYIGNDDKDKKDLIDYVNCVVEGIKTGVFSYVAHPDAFNYPIDSTYEKHMGKICTASKEYNIPLELNLYGIRDKRLYPRDKFWAMAGEIGCPVTFGFDSHDVKSAYDGDSIEVAEQFVTKHKLNYIGRPNIINI